MQALAEEVPASSPQPPLPQTQPDSITAAVPTAAAIVNSSVDACPAEGHQMRATETQPQICQSSSRTAAPPAPSTAQRATGIVTDCHDASGKDPERSSAVLPAPVVDAHVDDDPVEDLEQTAQQQPTAAPEAAITANESKGDESTGEITESTRQDTEMHPMPHLKQFKPLPVEHTLKPSAGGKSSFSAKQARTKQAEHNEGADDITSAVPREDQPVPPVQQAPQAIPEVTLKPSACGQSPFSAKQSRTKQAEQDQGADDITSTVAHEDQPVPPVQQAPQAIPRSRETSIPGITGKAAAGLAKDVLAGGAVLYRDFSAKGMFLPHSEGITGAPQTEVSTTAAPAQNSMLGFSLTTGACGGKGQMSTVLVDSNCTKTAVACMPQNDVAGNVPQQIAATHGCVRTAHRQPQTLLRQQQQPQQHPGQQQNGNYSAPRPMFIKPQRPHGASLYQQHKPTCGTHHACRADKATHASRIDGSLTGPPVGPAPSMSPAQLREEYRRSRERDCAIQGRNKPAAVKVRNNSGEVVSDAEIANHVPAQHQPYKDSQNSKKAYQERTAAAAEKNHGHDPDRSPAHRRTQDGGPRFRGRERSQEPNPNRSDPPAHANVHANMRQGEHRQRSEERGYARDNYLHLNRADTGKEDSRRVNPRYDRDQDKQRGPARALDDTLSPSRAPLRAAACGDSSRSEREARIAAENRHDGASRGGYMPRGGLTNDSSRVRREQGGFLPDAERRRGGLCRDRLAPSRDRTPDKSPAPAHEGEQQPSEPRQEQRKGRDANSKEQRDGNTAAQKSRVQSGNAGSREAVGQVRGSDRANEKERTVAATEGQFLSNGEPVQYVRHEARLGRLPAGYRSSKWFLVDQEGRLHQAALGKERQKGTGSFEYNALPPFATHVELQDGSDEKQMQQWLDGFLRHPCGSRPQHTSRGLSQGRNRPKSLQPISKFRPCSPTPQQQACDPPYFRHPQNGSSRAPASRHVSCSPPSHHRRERNRERSRTVPRERGDRAAHASREAQQRRRRQDDSDDGCARDARAHALRATSARESDDIGLTAARSRQRRLWSRSGADRDDIDSEPHASDRGVSGETSGRKQDMHAKGALDVQPAADVDVRDRSPIAMLPHDDDSFDFDGLFDEPEPLKKDCFTIDMEYCPEADGATVDWASPNGTCCPSPRFKSIPAPEHPVTATTTSKSNSNRKKNHSSLNAAAGNCENAPLNTPHAASGVDDELTVTVDVDSSGRKAGTNNGSAVHAGHGVVHGMANTNAHACGAAGESRAVQASAAAAWDVATAAADGGQQGPSHSPGASQKMKNARVSKSGGAVAAAHMHGDDIASEQDEEQQDEEDEEDPNDPLRRCALCRGVRKYSEFGKHGKQKHCQPCRRLIRRADMMSSEYDMAWLEEALLTNTIVERLGSVAFSASTGPVTTRLCANTHSHIPTIEDAPQKVVKRLQPSKAASERKKTAKAARSGAPDRARNAPSSHKVSVNEKAHMNKLLQKVRKGSSGGKAARGVVGVPEVSPSALAAAALDATVAAAEAVVAEPAGEFEDDDNECHFASNFNMHASTGAVGDDFDLLWPPSEKKRRRFSTAAILDSDSADDDNYVMCQKTAPKGGAAQHNATEAHVRKATTVAKGASSAAPTAVVGATAPAPSSAPVTVGGVVHIQDSDEEEEAQHFADAQTRKADQMHQDALQRNRAQGNQAVAKPRKPTAADNNQQACVAAAGPPPDTDTPVDTCQACDGEGAVAVQNKIGIGSVTHDQQCNAYRGSSTVVVSPEPMHAAHGATKKLSSRADSVHALERNLNHSPAKKNEKDSDAPKSKPVQSNEPKAAGGGEQSAVQGRRRCALCRGIRHEGAFSQSESKSGPSARCKPCERLYRGVISKGFNLDWLKQHLQDGSIRQSHPDLFKATKHGRPVTTCMSPDADVAWSGDKLEPEREKEANPKKRTFDQVAAGAGPSELHGGQQHDADMGTTQGADGEQPETIVKRTRSYAKPDTLQDAHTQPQTQQRAAVAVNPSGPKLTDSGVAVKASKSVKQGSQGEQQVPPGNSTKRRHTIGAPCVHNDSKTGGSQVAVISLNVLAEDSQAGLQPDMAPPETADPKTTSEAAVAAAAPGRASAVDNAYALRRSALAAYGNLVKLSLEVSDRILQPGISEEEKKAENKTSEELQKQLREIELLLPFSRS